MNEENNNQRHEKLKLYLKMFDGISLFYGSETKNYSEQMAEVFAAFDPKAYLFVKGSFIQFFKKLKEKESADFDDLAGTFAVSCMRDIYEINQVYTIDEQRKIYSEVRSILLNDKIPEKDLAYWKKQNTQKPSVDSSKKEEIDITAMLDEISESFPRPSFEKFKHLLVKEIIFNYAVRYKSMRNDIQAMNDMD